MNLGYFISRGITLFDRSYANLQARVIYKYPKNKIQEVTEKNMNVLHTGI